MCRKYSEIFRLGSRGAVFFFVFTGCRVLDALVNGVWKNLVKVQNLDKVKCGLFVKSEVKRRERQGI